MNFMLTKEQENFKMEFVIEFSCKEKEIKNFKGL